MFGSRSGGRNKINRNFQNTVPSVRNIAVIFTPDDAIAVKGWLFRVYLTHTHTFINGEKIDELHTNTTKPKYTTVAKGTFFKIFKMCVCVCARFCACKVSFRA